MGNVLIGFLGILVTIFIAALSRTLADEFKAWQPHWTSKLIGAAVRILPEHERERYHEEWSAHAEDIPGDLGKLFYASGLIWAAYSMGERKILTLGIKRAMDIVFSVVALVALAPQFALVSLAIKLESPGPLFVAYPRIGKHGRNFRLYKFRSTRLASSGQPDRLTTVGRLIRILSLDEIPQMYNVLRGDMSLVGPRPMPPHVNESEQYLRILELRHQVRPGLTGLAQVARFKGTSGDRSALISDIVYVTTHSIDVDLGILIKTAIDGFRADIKSSKGRSLCAAALVVAPLALTLGGLIGFLALRIAG